MSETTQTTDTDKTGFTGDRELYKQRQRAYEAAKGTGRASADGQLVALALRAGLAEIAVEISSIRGFGIGQAHNRR